MSSAVLKYKVFLDLILQDSTTQIQRHGLVRTCTEQQAKVIIEICFNLHFGVIPLCGETKRTVAKHKRIIDALASKLPTKRKLKIIRAQYKSVCVILLSLKNQLKRLLRA